MWILIKLTITTVAFCGRFLANYFSLTFRSGEDIQIENMTCCIQMYSTKHGAKTTTLFIPFKSKAIFELRPEKKMDRFFKKIGISTEFQTGDITFDNQIYILSDNSALGREMAANPKARECIRKLFSGSCKKIRSNTKDLTVIFEGDQTQNQESLNIALQLQKSLLDLDRRWSHVLSDPFLIREFVVEAFIWSLGGFAITSFFEWDFNSQSYHLDPTTILVNGVILGVALAALLCGFIVFIMRGSSKGHHIILQGVFILGFCLPASGPAILSDANRGLDQSPSMWAERKVINCVIEKRHSRKRGTKYIYHLHLSPPDSQDNIPIPTETQVRQDQCSAATPGMTAKIELGRGRFHHPWFRSITFQ